MNRALLATALLAATVAGAQPAPCVPARPAAEVKVALAPGSTLAEVAAWFQSVTCIEPTGPASAFQKKVSLGFSGTISAARAGAVLEAAAAAAGYELANPYPSLRVKERRPTLVEWVPGCDPEQAKAALARVAASGGKSCVLDLKALGRAVDGPVCLDTALSVDGLTVSRLAEGSLWHALGLREGDVLSAWGGSPLTVETAGTLLLDFPGGPDVQLDVKRAGKTVPLRCAVSAGETTPRDFSPISVLRSAIIRTKTSRSGGVKPSDFQLNDAGTQVSVSPSLAALDPSCLATSMRIVPAFRDGRAEGFKLFGIRPESLPALLGFRNGDLVLKVNGRALSSPESALEAYSALRSEKTFAVELERNGAPMTLRIVTR